MYLTLDSTHIGNVIRTCNANSALVSDAKPILFFHPIISTERPDVKTVEMGWSGLLDVYYV